ncbi:MAG: hypothetical protein AB4911_06260 [Oscillochloridaceae bacterium umkhey_bin13]
MRTTLHPQLERLASDRWARRGIRILLRASILALALICLAVGLHLALDWPLYWNWVAAAALVCVALGAILVLQPRLSAKVVARRLDRRFRLNEQLTTALEVGPQSEGVGLYLHEQARQNLARIRRQIAARQSFPWSDLILALALGLLVLGLLVLSGLGSALPPLAREPLPPLVQVPPPAERFPEEPFQPPPGDQAGPGETLVPDPNAAAALAALADALRDQSVTRPAAEALDQGNLGEAARRLRELADQAGNLSNQSRSELAQSLRQAADQIAPTNPELAEQVRQSANELAPTGNAPSQGLENLADAVEQLGQGQGAAGQQGADAPSGAGQGEGAGQGAQPGQQRDNPADRLGVDGVPLELKSEAEGTTRADGSDATQTSETGGNAGGGGFARGSQSAERVEAADDPLRIPADLRDVVQDYFSP